MLLHEIVLTWILEEISFGAKLERKSCEVNFVENEACSIGQSQQNDTLEGCINLCRLGTFGQGCNFTNDNVTACQFLSAELEDEEYREIGKKYGDCYLSSHEVIIDESLLSHDNQNNYNRQFKHSCWIESGKNCSHISCFTTHNNIALKTLCNLQQVLFSIVIRTRSTFFRWIMSIQSIERQQMGWQ